MSDPDIVCKITPWFWKRMGLMASLFALFALWFFYDGKVKWPKDNEVKAAYDDFVEVMLPEFDKFTGEEAMSLEEWKILAAEKGWADYLKEDGEPKKWSSYAAANGWPEKKPKGHSQSDVDGQFRWAAGCGVLALGILGYLLFNLKKTIGADSEAYITDQGKRILFSEIYEVDKRKWDDKGLASVRFKGEGGAGKVPLDDLKYDGGEKILERILENFEGDLIEAVVEKSDEDKGDEGKENEEIGEGREEGETRA